MVSDGSTPTTRPSRALAAASSRPSPGPDPTSSTESDGLIPRRSSTQTGRPRSSDISRPPTRPNMPRGAQNMFSITCSLMLMGEYVSLFTIFDLLFNVVAFHHRELMNLSQLKAQVAQKLI